MIGPGHGHSIRAAPGGVAERLNAPVLKTGGLIAHVGSNPTPSADYSLPKILRWSRRLCSAISFGTWIAFTMSQTKVPIPQPMPIA